jgi:hypothetical protein
MGTGASSLRKSEFMDKFYTGLGAKQKDQEEFEEVEEKKARLHSMGNIDSRKSVVRVKPADFHDKHKKLFTRESNREKEKKPAAAKSTLFEKFREDYSDPFESAKESGATVGQIKLLNFSMFALG